jgi:fimbrial chaperone protein
MTSIVAKIARYAVCLTGLLFAAHGACEAGDLEVAPILVELPPSAMSALLTVTNRGGQPSTIQIRTVAWTQDATGDQFAPTHALFASPPIFEIPAGGSQAVRILLREPPKDVEAAYRLLLDELPGTGATGVQISLRISLPVLAKPDSRALADLRWSAAPSGGGADIIVVNRGAAAERVAGLNVAIDGSDPVKPVSAPDPWILPGTERRWHVALRHPAGNGLVARLTGTLRAGSLNVTATFNSAR